MVSKNQTPKTSETDKKEREMKTKKKPPFGLKIVVEDSGPVRARVRVCLQCALRLASIGLVSTPILIAVLGARCELCNGGPKGCVKIRLTEPIDMPATRAAWRR